MDRGGYQIIDLKDVPLTTEGVKIPGISQKVLENKRKAILLSGINFNGTLLADTFVTAVQLGTEIVMSVYSTVVLNELDTFDIYISDDDTVYLQVKGIKGDVPAGDGKQYFTVKEASNG